MESIYHYTRFETFMSYILPTGCIRPNSLRYMNDPRESLDWAFGSTNLPYEEIFKGYYSDKTHIDCQFKYGNLIKDKYQVLCFSGARSKGWNNEMMWAHYGGMHSGVCLEFDEDMLLENIRTKYPEALFDIENISYSNKKESPWLHWQSDKSEEENMQDILKCLVKDMTLSKSGFWEREDERRLVCRGFDEHLYIPIDGALKTVYLGVSFNKLGREMMDSVFRTLNGISKLSVLIYENNRFKRWSIKLLAKGKIGSCDFEDVDK